MYVIHDDLTNIIGLNTISVLDMLLVCLLSLLLGTVTIILYDR